ncbi:MAG TPA: hypothetical protein VJ302_30720 [Blastocatellia bacterium]|nr:hypothetical protein [Blastocatellia bacterium]
MTPKEREAYYVARRKAILAGDDGVLPGGKTVRQEREEYAALCQADQTLTRPDQNSPEGAAAVAAELAADSDLPANLAVAPDLSDDEIDPEIANKRCCG